MFITKIILIITMVLFLCSPVSVMASGKPLDQVNQTVCDRFEVDVSRMAGIMDELRARKGITATRVAYGGINTPIENADYWVNFAAEAIAYQRAHTYSSASSLRSDLEVLVSKDLKAKAQVGLALNEN